MTLPWRTPSNLCCCIQLIKSLLIIRDTIEYRLAAHQSLVSLLFLFFIIKSLSIYKVRVVYSVKMLERYAFILRKMCRADTFQSETNWSRYIRWLGIRKHENRITKSIPPFSIKRSTHFGLRLYKHLYTSLGENSHLLYWFREIYI